MEEIEVKFLNIDPDALQKKLEAIGAKKVGEFFYRRRVFDYPDWRLNSAGAWLRVRDEGDKVTMSYKQRLGMPEKGVEANDAGMEEIEVVVSDFDKTVELLFKLGFIEKHYAETRRIRWEKDGAEFDIDFWPGIEPLLEIETKSWKKIDEAIGWLGLDQKDKKIFSSYQVYALKGIDVGEYVRLAFDGLVKR